eukprot:TRINITY_DN7096_c0_g1_i1.p1 TRINITY_DN7096_c0_g1~~TRINITY_DN7096_c0_g1_i1.p1  ORF type:complete len:310 (-),score=94.95 TRINITY_DN7096_c0_g1_i1:391-1320(-)
MAQEQLTLVLRKLDEVLLNQRHLERRLVSLESEISSNKRVQTREDRENSRQLVENFLTEQQISTDLCEKIRAEFEEKSNPAPRMEEIEAFKMMNSTLTNELLLELRKKLLVLHPLFTVMREATKDEEFLDRVCLEACSTLPLSRGDVLIEANAAHSLCPQDCMAFVMKGQLEVKDKNDMEMRRLTPGQWVSEPSVWMDAFRRTCTVVAAEETTVLLMSGTKVAFLVDQLPLSAKAKVCTYGANYIEVLKVKVQEYHELPIDDKMHMSVAHGKVQSGGGKTKAISLLREIYKGPLFEEQVSTKAYFSRLF